MPGPLDYHRGNHGHHGNQHKRSGTGERPRPVLPEPARHFFDPALGVSRRRLVGQPVLEVLRQRANRAVPGVRLIRHCLQADRLERRRDRAVTARGGGKSPAITLAITSDSFFSWNGAFPVISS